MENSATRHAINERCYSKEQLAKALRKW